MYKKECRGINGASGNRKKGVHQSIYKIALDSSMKREEKKFIFHSTSQKEFQLLDTNKAILY